jgi:hypothetical protein
MTDNKFEVNKTVDCENDRVVQINEVNYSRLNW